MTRQEINAENTVFVILSFEGPDLYSMAGGLGVRVTNLSQSLADMGFPVHLFFIGDPGLPGEEVQHDGKLTLHRWCQWISRYYPPAFIREKTGNLGTSACRFPHSMMTLLGTPSRTAPENWSRLPIIVY